MRVSKTIIYEKNTTIKNRTIYLRVGRYVAIITPKYVKKTHILAINIQYAVHRTERTTKNFKIFNLNDIRKIEENFDLRRLNEWQKKNYIKKIRQGFYIFSDLEINEQALFIIANRIHEPSYISLEMALSFTGLYRKLCMALHPSHRKRQEP